MKSRFHISLYLFVAMFLIVFPLSLFAATTDKDLTLDDGAGDSPQLILKDQTGDNTLTLQKMDAGEADIVNNEGAINLKPSNDLDDFIYFLTSSDLIGFYWDGVLAYTNDPAVRINSSGQLEYRDQDEATWTAFDSMAAAVTDGTAASNTLRWDGASWVESTALINDDTDVTLSGDLAVNGGDIASTGALTVTPNAGSSMNVALSTTGDFIVNTDDLVVDTSTGNVGIGTNTPDAAYALDVNGNILVNDGIYSRDSHLHLEAATNSYVEIKPGHATLGLVVREYNSTDWGNIAVTSNGFELGYKTTSTTVRIDTNGYAYIRRIGVNLVTTPTYGIYIYNTGDNNTSKGWARNWIDGSDGRLKVNRKELSKGLDKVLKMEPIYFYWLDSDYDENGNLVIGDLQDGGRDIGFVAQDMFEIVPESVSFPEDEAKGIWGIDYGKITPVIVSAIQEQQEQIKKLKAEKDAEIAELKAKNTGLEQRLARLEQLLKQD